jgi:hypothetical protein
VWAADLDGSNPEPLGISHAFDASPAPTVHVGQASPPCDVGRGTDLEPVKHTWFRKQRAPGGGFAIEPVVEESAAVRMSIRIVCDTSRVVVFAGGVRMKIVPSSDIADPPVLHMATVSKWKPDTGIQTIRLTKQEDCAPGVRLYNARAAFTAGSLVSLQPLTAGDASMPMRCNQDGVWRYRAYANLRGLPQGKVLERAMAAAARPRPVGGGWAAHHIIPAFQKTSGADGAQRSTRPEPGPAGAAATMDRARRPSGKPLQRET